MLASVIKEDTERGAYAYFIRQAFEKWIWASPVMRWFFAGERESTRVKVGAASTSAAMVPPSIAARDAKVLLACPGSGKQVVWEGAVGGLMDWPDVTQAATFLARAALDCATGGAATPRAAVVLASLYFTWEPAMRAWSDDGPPNALARHTSKVDPARVGLHVNSKPIKVIEARGLAGGSARMRGFMMRVQARVALPSLKNLRRPFDRVYGRRLAKWAATTGEALFLGYAGPAPPPLATLRIRRQLQVAPSRGKRVGRLGLDDGDEEMEVLSKVSDHREDVGLEDSSSSDDEDLGLEDQDASSSSPPEEDLGLGDEEGDDREGATVVTALESTSSEDDTTLGLFDSDTSPSTRLYSHTRALKAKKRRALLRNRKAILATLAKRHHRK